MSRPFHSLLRSKTQAQAFLSPILKKYFEPYYQGIISDKVENLGAGLGLSLCKEIIELYSGQISVSSELGKGTTVNFSINLKINK